MIDGLFCMAVKCWREAYYDLGTWPLCRNCKNASREVERRWGPRDGHEAYPNTHIRKELLGGSES